LKPIELERIVRLEMAEPFLGEIRIFGFNFAPTGWAFCSGQLLPIQQNAALFSILGTTYGGDGTTSFALPDFQGRVPMHMGSGFVIGQRGGEEQHTLNISEYPQHVHPVAGQSGQRTSPTPAATAVLASGDIYGLGPPDNTTLSPLALGNSGGSQPHENRQPYLALNFCIAMQGIFPSQN
jgi:microcystin-dependent protein